MSKPEQDPKEPFVSEEDRPAVQIDPNTPVSQLRLRDLAAILGPAATKTKENIKIEVKDFKEAPEKFKAEKFEKFEHKEVKFEKIEHKEHKEKFEHKEIKLEKFEHKELKLEKLEHGGEVVKPLEPGPIPDPGPLFEGGMNQVVERIASLHEKIDQLTNQIAEMQKKQPN
jgi:hypothetical protein